MRKRKIMAGMFLLSAGMALTGCSAGTQAVSTASAEIAAATETFVIPTFFADEEDIQTFIDGEKGNQTCTDIYLNADNAIEVVVTAEEKQNWIDRADMVIESFTGDTLNGQGYMIQINEDRNAMQIHGVAGLNTYQLLNDAMLVMLNAEIWQVLQGVDPWSVAFSVYDDNTGELLQEVNFPTEDLMLSEEMWEQAPGDPPVKF